MPDRPHHLPASFIGGFGQPDPHDPEDLRITRVCVRRQDPDKLLQNMKAEDIGFEYGIYGVEKPTADLPADYAETEWKKYEPKLPRAIRALDSGAFGPAEWRSSCCTCARPGRVTPTLGGMWPIRKRHRARLV